MRQGCLSTVLHGFCLKAAACCRTLHVMGSSHCLWPALRLALFQALCWISVPSPGLIVGLRTQVGMLLICLSEHGVVIAGGQLLPHVRAH